MRAALLRVAPSAPNLALIACVLLAACSSPSNDSPFVGSGGANAQQGGQSSAMTGGSSTATGGSTATVSGGTTSSATGGSGTSSTGGTATSSGGTPTGMAGTSSKGGASSAGAAGKAGVGGKAGGGSSGAGGSTGGAVSAGGSGGASATTGCAKSGQATGVQNLTIDVAGKSRSYVLSLPANYNASTPYPLVFAWHGLGGSGSIARQYFGVERQSMGRAVFVYPDGLPIESQDGKAGWDLSPTGIDVQFFDALLTAMSANYCVDATRVFATGHSFGAFFSNRLGCSRASVLRAIATVAGGPPFGGGSCSARLSSWLAHGTADDTVEFSQGEAARDLWLKNDGCSTTTQAVEPAQCMAYQGCADGMRVHFCAHDGGHDWPSFAAGGIWSFFSSF